LSGLKNGLAAVMADEGERLRRGKAALEFAKRFSWDKVGRDLADLYRDVVLKS
jgi:glycosyltransferase involved in cell wall biosynthesis